MSLNTVTPDSDESNARNVTGARNAPLTNAERQARYRAKRQAQTSGISSGSPAPSSAKPKQKHAKAKNEKGPKPALPTPRLYAPPPSNESTRKYPPEVIDDIFRRVSHGETLTQACKSHPNYPSHATVIDWTIKDPVMADRYARARDGQAARWADDIVDKVKTATPETANVVRLEIDAKKWLLARIRPAQYGDRLDVTSDNKPLQTVDASLAIKALLDALPSLTPAALPAPIDVVATEVPSSDGGARDADATAH